MPTSRSLAVWVGLGAMLLAGCGSSSVNRGNPGGGGGDGTAACSQLSTTAPVITVDNSTRPQPTPAGGAVVPGLYYLTRSTSYYVADGGVEAGASTTTVQETASFGPANPVGIEQSVISTNGSPNETDSFQYFASGPSLFVTQTCPTSSQAVLAYTATSTQVITYVSRGSHVSEQVLTLQSAFDAGLPPADAGATGTRCSQSLSDAQVACNAVCNLAPSIPVVGKVGTAPTPAGGTIADGTYYTTSKTLWGGPDAGLDGSTFESLSETLVIATSNGIWLWQDVQSKDGGPEETATLSLVPAGAAYLDLTAVCPASIRGQGRFGFTVKGNTVQILEPRNGTVEETVLTRQ